MSTQLESLLNQVRELHCKYQAGENLIAEIRKTLGITSITILQGIKNLQEENRRLKESLNQKEVNCHIVGCVVVPSGTTVETNYILMKHADFVITEDGVVLKNRYSGITGKIVQN